MAALLPEHLISGYQDYCANRLPSERARLRELADGQRPTTMVIGCCDSRAAPEMLFNSAPGEIFVVRNVANLVPPYEPDGEYHSTSAAIEFAVHGLEIAHIVVLGHARCGGIQAALAHPAPLSPGDFIGKWMSLLEPVARRVGAHYETPDQQIALERASIVNSLENLRTFPTLRQREAEGRLALHGAWYNIASGELWALDQETGQFVPQF